MFEKLRIKEHMEVADSQGHHVGTVDEVDGDVIKLTRSDSADGQHHRIPFDQVDRVADNRIYLKVNAALPTGAQQQQHAAGTQEQQWSGNTAATAAEYSTRPDPSGSAPANKPLFGTSGNGTGFGGSGIGNE